MSGQFDLFGGFHRRDEGKKRVADNNAVWMEQAMWVIASLPVGWRGLPEDVRPKIEEICGEPTRPHAYGSLTTKAIRAGLWRRTGVRKPMRRKTSNGRMTDEYMRVR